MRTGLVLGRGVHVQNAAPEGELAHALHLLAPGVPQRPPAGRPAPSGRTARRCSHRHDAARPAHPGTGCAGMQALHRGYDQGRFVPGTCRSRRPAAGAPTGGRPPRRRGSRNSRAASRVTCSPVKAVRSSASRWASVSSAHTITTGQSSPPVEPGGEVGPVDGGQAGHRRRRAAAVQRGQQLLEFRHVIQDLQQSLHGSILTKIGKIWNPYGTKAPRSPAGGGDAAFCSRSIILVHGPVNAIGEETFHRVRGPGHGRCRWSFCPRPETGPAPSRPCCSRGGACRPRRS